jgi:hypothetical protein
MVSSGLSHGCFRLSLAITFTPWAGIIATGSGWLGMVFPRLVPGIHYLFVVSGIRLLQKMHLQRKSLMILTGGQSLGTWEGNCLRRGSNSLVKHRNPCPWDTVLGTTIWKYGDNVPYSIDERADGAFTEKAMVS